MELYNYLALSNEDQWDTLWEEGKYLATFTSIDCKYVLYGVGKFFIEVELCPIKGNIIGKGEFIHGAKMEKYIGDIGANAHK